VTGTTFNVLAESPAALDVTVVEGSVQVRPSATAGGSTASADAPAALKAGDHLRARAASGVTVEKLSDTALADTLAWRQGKIVFDDVPLSEASLASPTITVAHRRLARGRATSHQLRFSLDDLDGFFCQPC